MCLEGRKKGGVKSTDLRGQVAECCGHLGVVTLFTGYPKLPSSVDAPDHVVKLWCSQHTCNRGGRKEVGRRREGEGGINRQTLMIITIINMLCSNQC